MFNMYSFLLVNTCYFLLYLFLTYIGVLFADS